MKIRFLLPILVLAADIAGGATFKLPKDSPQFSIEMPDKWVTEVKGDLVFARPAKDSKVNIFVGLIPEAKSQEEAFAGISKEVAAHYQEFNVGKTSHQKEAGIDFFGAEGKGKREGVEFRVALAVFSPDGQRYFALSWECDEISGETYGSDIDRTLNSIKLLKEDPTKKKETGGKDTSTLSFPKDKPAFTIEVPNAFTTDATAERLIIKPAKKHRSFFHLAAIPSADGVSDDVSAKAWLTKKAKSLLGALGVKDANARQEAENYGPGIAGHKAFESRYSGGDLDELQLWVFIPDGKSYFYAYYQRMTENIFEDAEANVGPGWQSNLLHSIKAAK